MTRRFVSDLGCLPWSARALREYARKKNLALPAAGSLREAREQLIAEARAAGNVAPELPPAGARPSIDVAPAPADAAHRALSQWEDVDRVVDGLVLAMREVRAGAVP